MVKKRLSTLLKIFLVIVFISGFLTPIMKDLTFAEDEPEIAELDANEEVIEEEEIDNPELIDDESDIIDNEESINNDSDPEVSRMTRAGLIKQIGDSVGQTFKFSNAESDFYSLYVGTELVYCIEPGTWFNTGGTVEETSLSYLSSDMQKKVLAAMHYGYHGKGLGNDDDAVSKPQRVITQTIIWALISGATTSAAIDAYCAPIQAYITSQGVQSYYDNLKSKTLAAFNKPSFDNTTVSLSWNPATTRYEARVTDTNQVLDGFNYQAAGISFQKNGNELLVYTTNNYRTGAQATAQISVTGGMIIWAEPDENDPFQRIGQYVAGIGGYTASSQFTIQTVSPEIGTSATANDTNEHISNVNETVTITDVVTYSNLTPGESYTIKGILMNKATNSPLKVNNTDVLAEKTFVPTTASGTVNLDFTFNASALEGTSVVVFERLYVGTIELATHTNINDAGQTIEFPKLRTTATNKEDGGKNIGTDKLVTIVDTITYNNLLPGKEYTVKGVLMNKSTGLALLTNNGSEIHAEKTFTPTTASGIITLEFTFDATLLYDTTIVVFEKLYYNSIEVGSHTDINDKEQSVSTPKKPSLKTTAIAQDTNEHISNINEKVTILDTVAYKNLEIGKEYTLKGKLMNKTTGNPLLDKGKEVTSQITFTPTTTDGSITMEFIFDARALEGVKIVVFEKLLKNGDEVGTHEDINDEGQTVNFPKIRTKASDLENGDKNISTDKTVTIVDAITFTNLLPGKEYTVKGVLMDKSTGKPLLTYEGAEIHAEKTFIPTTASGIVDLEFTFDATLLYDKTIVVFEKLYFNTIEVGSHTDINDKEQTIYTPKKPSLKTTAIAKDTKDHISNTRKKVTLIDTVAYKNLEVGKEYTLKGKLMNTSTGQPLVVNGKEVTSEITFTPTTADGSVKVEFIFDARELEGIEVVVFEKLEKNGYEVGTHEDIKDKGQTVNFPKIRTTAKNPTSGNNTATTDKKLTIIDKVQYTNLLPGKEYTIKGVLMNKATEKPLLVNGEQITSTITFTPDSANGFVELEFTLDASALNNTTIVVFERLYFNNIEIASHTNINDKEQTIQVTKKTPEKKSVTNKKVLSTGDNMDIKTHAYLTISSLLIIGYLSLSKRKKENIG